MLGRKSWIFVILIVVIAFYLRRPKQLNLGKLVKTKLGLVQGLLSNSRDGREFYEWLGIPFARPPVGDLRFASTKPVEKWDGILNATHHGQGCAHHHHVLYGLVLGEEDCLYLNIYAPKLKDEQKLPVMVYFHGGGFKSGSSDLYNPKYFMDEDVIVVTVNYRLSVLGFLATDDKSIRGNMGLKDQVQALKWVQENIPSFGGDPGKVTIFGHSAGGASVHYLTLSPMATNLFHRAISHSGVATNPWAFMSPEKMQQKTKMIARTLGCRSGSSQQLAICLRNASIKDLMDAVWNDANEDMLTQPHNFGCLPVPTIEVIDDDEAFLAQHPLDLISQGKGQRIPWMVGYTADEGLLSTIQFKNDKNTLFRFEGNIDTCLKSVFAIESNANESSSNTTKTVQDFYFPGSESNPVSTETEEMATEKKIQTYAKLLGDSFFKFDIRESILYQRQFSQVYPYFYNNSGGPSMNQLVHSVFGTKVTRFLEVVILSLKLTVQHLFLGMDPPEDNEIGHVADLGFLFSFHPVLDISQSSKHYSFSKSYVKLLVDFATMDASPLTFRWIEFPATPKKGPLKFLHITSDIPEVISEPGEERMKFLSSLGIRKYSSSYNT